MVVYAVFGLGLMGKAIVYDLLTHDENATVVGYEYDENRLCEILDYFKDFSARFSAYQLTLEQGTDLKNELENIDVAIGAIDYQFNLMLTKNCIKYQSHFLDLGGNPTVVGKQHQLTNDAENAEVLIIPDCGLAPGMVNVLAAGIMNQFDELDECHIRVGGLPQEPKGILNYQQVFSIRGLTNEYIEDAIVIRNREIQSVESLTEVEQLHFPHPYDQLEAFQTAGGTSSLPRIFRNRINHLTYKTIRYEGHVQYFQFLKEYGLLSAEIEKGFSHPPRDFLEYHLEEHLPKNEPDVVLIRLTISGTKEGESIVETWDCIDHQSTFSAMARTTGFPISIIAMMIGNNQINNRGVVAGEECVPFDQFLEELERRDIRFKTTTFYS